MDNSSIILIALIAFLAIALLIFWPRRMPYTAWPSLLTAAEMRFYKVLLQATDLKKYTLMVKVRLADIITCAEHDWHKGHGPMISAKHIDFVIVDKQSFKPLLCIELDDKSHDTKPRKRRDTFVNKALKAANVPLLRQRVTHKYDVNALRADINKLTLS